MADLRYMGNQVVQAWQGCPPPPWPNSASPTDGAYDTRQRQPARVQALGIGIIGGGFVTGFHLQAFVGVREDTSSASGAGRVSAPKTRGARRQSWAPPQPFASIAAMVADPAVDAIWICAPNYARVETVQAIVSAVGRGARRLTGIACEKPLVEPSPRPRASWSS